MQLFRSLCVVAVLGALTYGAYVTLTGSPPVEPPLDAVNWDSPPPVELPARGGATSSTSAGISNSTPPGAPAPKFSPPSMGAARLDAPTDSIGGAPMKAAALDPRAGEKAVEIPASYPKTGAPPGPFDAAGSSPLGTDAAPYPSTATGDAGPMLPGLSLTPPGTNVDKSVSPVAGQSPGGSTPNVISAAPTGAFQIPWNEINSLIVAKPAEALDRLSRSFDDPTLSAEENRRVMESLDQLAGTVIYSRDHLLAPAYVVQPGEGLEQIAVKHNVPWELLAKINGIADPANLAPGTQLKVVKGPFCALVDKSRRQMTLFLGGLYAGSFNVGFGQDQAAADGYYKVVGKSFEPSRSLRVLDLGNGISVHSAIDTLALENDFARGCIRLDPAQAADVYDILSVGSEIIVRP